MTDKRSKRRRQPGVALRQLWNTKEQMYSIRNRTLHQITNSLRPRNDSSWSTVNLIYQHLWNQERHVRQLERTSLLNQWAEERTRTNVSQNLAVRNQCKDEKVSKHNKTQGQEEEGDTFWDAVDNEERHFDFTDVATARMSVRHDSIVSLFWLECKTLGHGFGNLLLYLQLYEGIYNVYVTFVFDFITGSESYARSLWLSLVVGVAALRCSSTFDWFTAPSLYKCITFSRHNSTQINHDCLTQLLAFFRSSYFLSVVFMVVGYTSIHYCVQQMNEYVYLYWIKLLESLANISNDATATSISEDEEEAMFTTTLSKLPSMILLYDAFVIIVALTLLQSKGFEFS